MTPWRRHLRRARFFASASIAGLLIAAAVVMGVVQILLPVATRYPDFVARRLSARLHRPVAFSGISSQWQPSGPLLTVRDLRLGPGHPGGQSITLPHAALKFDFGAWLRPAHRWITLRLDHMELQLVHSTSGWQVAGFGMPGGESRASLQSLPVDLDLRNLRVDIADSVTQRSWQLFAPRLRVVNVGDSIRFGGRVEQSGTRQAVTLSGSAGAARHDFDLYLSTRALDLAAATRGVDLHGFTLRGSADLDLWESWRNGKLASSAARYTVRGLGVAGPQGRSAYLAVLDGVFKARRTADGWDIAWRGPGEPRADIDRAGGVIVKLRGHDPRTWQASAAARGVDAAPWLSLLAVVPQVPKAFADWVAHAQPHGRIDSAALVWDGRDNYDATLRLSDLRAAAAGPVPGLALAQVTLRADAAAMSLELPRQPAVLALTDVFRKPFTFTQLGGTFVAWRENGWWNVGADDLHFDTGSLAGSARAHLAWMGNGQPPFLSASAAVVRAKAVDAKWFWPYRSMPPTLVAWLDHAIVAGDVTAGRVLVRGNLGDWPFLGHQGRFEATGTVQGVEFGFADDWPHATAVDAALDFVGNRMGIVATHAKVRGVVATHAVAVIPDLGHGVLGLDVQGGGSGAELLDFVRHSPVGAGALDALDGMVVGGSGKFGIKLSIPLDDAAKFSLAGKLDLARADVTAAKWKLALKNLDGPLAIDATGFRAQNLGTTFRGAPAKLSMAVGSSNVADPADIVEATMDTSVSAQTLVQGYPDLAALAAHASGVAPFRIGVQVHSAVGKLPVTPVLKVQSSLAGIALDFPAPLDKAAAASLPLNLSLQLPPEGAPLTVSLGDVLQVRGRLADPVKKLPTALAMNFGSTPPASVPAEGFVVAGHAARLDISGWVEQAVGSPSGGAFPQLSQAHVDADNAEVFGTSLGSLQFNFEAGRGSDSIGFDGAAVKGALQLPTSGLMTRGITANLERLYWPEPPPAKQSVPTEPPPAVSPIAPAAVPPLHAAIGDLRLGTAHLGATSFESAPSPTGMRIARFDSKGSNFTIQSHGDWNGTRAASQSNMVIDISSHDFGKTLEAFGFSGLLAGGQNARVRIDGTWPGAPSGFSLAWMDGSLGIKVGEGRILAVKPGLGRLLGLLSLKELPSRLMLHFGDVFKSGFGFDHAEANFTLKDGNAYTRDLLITAPAAQIAMAGRTGFREHDFDLAVDVTPHVGGTLPVVGAVIGGPVGAAAGLVVQGLLGKGINKAAGSMYQVTGSWEKPKIVTIAASPAPAGSMAPAATASPLPTPGIPVAPASGASSAAIPAAASSGG